MDAVVIDFVVTRTHKVNLKFYCTYPRRKYLSISFEPQQVFFGDEGNPIPLVRKADPLKLKSQLNDHNCDKW